MTDRSITLIKKIGILSTRGLPARYGAFEQTVSQLVLYSFRNSINLKFYVATDIALRSEPFYLNNVVRVYGKRSSGIGVILYGLTSFLKMYFMGVRTYIAFGYGLSPFFGIFKMLGCKIICNVDGIEWRRQKWNSNQKEFMKFCEYCAVRFSNQLIFDSVGIERYYRIKYRAKGLLSFYGVENFDVNQLNNVDFPQILIPGKYLVVVMRLEPENNILQIVEGFIASNCPHKLVIIGPPTEFYNHMVLPKIVEDERVTWLGPIYDRELLARIRIEAACYLHGHSVGGTNPTLVEACSFGKPIIAYNSIFNREVLGSLASYFSNAAELTEILNLSFYMHISPPKLSKKYTWECVSEEYLSLLF